MKNPWLAKNPYMSLWLSTANKLMAPARSMVIAEGRRQAAAMRAEATKQILEFWTPKKPASKGKRSKKR